MISLWPSAGNMLRLARMQQQPTTDMMTAARATRLIDTPLGAMLAVANERGILRLEFDPEAEPGHFDCPADKQQDRAESHLSKLTCELAEYFAGTRTEFTVPVIPFGSDFERRAWEFLRAIPFGQTRSYGQQARAIAGPNAARAVGGANGRNPIAIVIPCHRVIGADGSLTGFASGLHRKQWLLKHEGAACCADAPSLFSGASSN